jgi:hypothetical protein
MIKLFNVETVLAFFLIMWLFNHLGPFEQRGGIAPEVKNFGNWVAIVLLILFVVFR